MSSNNGIAIAGSGALVLDDERMELLRKTIANGAPPLEFEMFVADCNRRGLDPFAKQTYLIKRGDKWQQQTSIDGYRLIADRTGKYAGSDEPVYDTEDAEHPNKATVTVWKIVGGVRCPFASSARWSEYAVEVPIWENRQKVGNKLSDMWQRMPYVMLAKCAESAALRKAFPQELSGLYTREEMEQAETVDRTTGEIVSRVTVTQTGNAELVEDDDTEMSEADRHNERERASRRYFAKVNEKGLTVDERHAIQRIAYGVESSNDLDTRQLDSLTLMIHKRTAEELRSKIATDEVIEDGEIVRTDTDPASPVPDFVAKIRAAESDKELKHVAGEMQALGVWAPEIAAALTEQRSKLGLAAPKMQATMSGTPPPIGEPGENRHTN